MTSQESRTIGFEVEYAGVSLEHTAELIHNQFGGNIEEENSAHLTVKNTSLGKFTIELDAIPLQKLAESSDANANSTEIISQIQHQVSKKITEIGSNIVPYEIVCPPIPEQDMPKLQTLFNTLRNQGAEGTEGSLYYAFGMHINPEALSLDVKYILRHLQTFLLLSPWLKREHHIDISRRITRFIDPFPNSYLKLVLNESYMPSMEQLIRDYHTHNPSRNRALDMLPLFAHINEKLVRKLYGQKEKISKRPTFHYRLPNCELGDKNWTLNTEWQRWQNVESIANNEEKFHSLLALWKNEQSKWITLESSWLSAVDTWIAEQNG